MISEETRDHEDQINGCLKFNFAIVGINYI